MNRFARVLGLTSLLLSAVLVAQVSINGSVTDLKTGDPLVGANVVVEGSELGTSRVEMDLSKLIKCRMAP